MKNIQKHNKDMYRNKYGIILNNSFDDISPIEWWKYMKYNTPNGNKLKAMPTPIYKFEDKIKEICIYVLEEEIGFKTREDLLTLTCKAMYDYKINFGSFPKINASPIKLLNFCYPQYNIKQFELGDVKNNYWKSDENKIEAMDWFMNKHGYSLQDVFNGNINTDDNFLRSIKVLYFQGSIYKMWFWYFSTKNIEINEDDFVYKLRGYWNKKSNIVKAIKNYCENKCSESIKKYIDKEDINGLNKWIYKYFTDKKAKQNKLTNSTKYSRKMYDLLVLAYPEIKEKNLFFQWEFIGYKKWDNQSYRINSLRELVLYRMNLKDLKNDIPRYLSFSYLKNTKYTKFITTNQKYYDGTNFYNWAIESFPEFKYCWDESNFGRVCVAYDGSKCNSIEERVLYEYLKKDKMLNVKSLGYKRIGKYVYKLPEEHQDNLYCPDFVVYKSNKYKLKYPIIIEYFGMCNYPDRYDFIIVYKEKIKRKNRFYSQLQDVYYLDIYPEDLKRNFKGVDEKFNEILKESM